MIRGVVRSGRPSVLSGAVKPVVNPGVLPTSLRVTTRVRIRRPNGRVNGRIARSPKASETKPGVSIRVPPIRMRMPSASSRAGILPSLSAAPSAAHARLPSRLISQEPKMLSAISSRIVHHTPITCPTWIST